MLHTRPTLHELCESSQSQTAPLKDQVTPRSSRVTAALVFAPLDDRAIGGSIISPATLLRYDCHSSIGHQLWGSAVSESNEPQLDQHQTDFGPLPYHLAIRDYLKQEQREVWDWYTSNRVRDDQADAVRFELLKSTYRVDRLSQAALYEAAEDVASGLELDVPVTVYQAQNPQGLNASLAYLPDEAHIVFHGSITKQLNDDELRALLGHELSHLLLWQGWDGEYLIVDQVLSALTCDANADAPHLETARLYRLYSEIFCDRGALAIMNRPSVVISMLVRVMTGADTVSAESYLRQADEIFLKGNVKTDEHTHPEAYIRARAIQLWADSDSSAEQKISEMIEGTPSLDRLDFLGQQQIRTMTRELLDDFLTPTWMHTDAVLAHARHFFHDFVPPTNAKQESTLADSLSKSHETIRDYFCYVLLDLVTADRDLEEFPLAAALSHSERLGVKERFVELARKELRLRKKQVDKIDASKDDLLAKVDKALATP